MKSCKSRDTQHGWALLESVVATALLGWIVFLVVVMSQGVHRERNSDQPLTVMTQSHLALLGYALLHHQFPIPDDYISSPGRAGYLEGWLPASKLGIDGGNRRIRYLVSTDLTGPPVIYKSDPLNLTGGQVVVRENPGIIDFCALLLRKDLSKSALPNGFRTAVALQQASAAGSEAPMSLPHIWLRDTAQEDLPADVHLHTLQRGFTEIATQLSCFGRMDKIVENVKMAGALMDMSRLAHQEVLRTLLAVRKNENSIANLIWRLTNVGVDVTSAYIRFGLSVAKIVQSQSPASVSAAVGLSILGARNSGLVAQLGDGLKEAVAAIPDLNSAVSTAKMYLDELDQEARMHVSAANQAQGVMPEEGP